MYISIVHNIQYRKIIMANIVIDRYTLSALRKTTRELYLKIQRATISYNRRNDVLLSLLQDIIHNYKQQTFTNALCIGVIYLRPIWILQL